VAVVDSALTLKHPDLKGKVKESVEAVAEEGRIEFRPSTSGDQAATARLALVSLPVSLPMPNSIA